MTFSLIVPSNVETAVTGFVMGAKKTIYKSEWQINIIQTTETKAEVTKNGQAVTMEEASKAKGFIKFWNDFISFYNSSRG